MPVTESSDGLKRPGGDGRRREVAVRSRPEGCGAERDAVRSGERDPGPGPGPGSVRSEAAAAAATGGGSSPPLYSPAVPPREHAQTQRRSPLAAWRAEPTRGVEGASLPPDVYPGTAAPGCVVPPSPLPSLPPGHPWGVAELQRQFGFVHLPWQLLGGWGWVCGFLFFFFFTNTIVSMAVKEY